MDKMDDNSGPACGDDEAVSMPRGGLAREIYPSSSADMVAHPDYRRTIKLWFRSEAERDHFLSIYPAREGSQEFINRAARAVEEEVLPRLKSGALGFTRKEIGIFTDKILRADLKYARSQRIHPDFRLCWRLSFQGHCIQIVDAFLENLKPANASQTASLPGLGAPPQGPQRPGGLGALLART